MKKILTACYNLKDRVKLRLQLFLYNLYLKRLIPKVAKRRPVKIMFYVNNLSMWKSDKLLILLNQDDRFDPFVVSFLYSNNSIQDNREIEHDIFTHFSSLGVPVSSGFDFEEYQLYPVTNFNADIIFYPQPYLNKVKDIPRNVLLSYIPYCFEMEDMKHFFYNTVYQNICWKLFVPSPLHKELKAKYNSNHGSNVVVAGNPLADYFFDGHIPSSENWPLDDPKIKRIIWAPHHSILSYDILDYSNFTEIADEMLNIAKKYEGKVQFVFKPHPMLKEKLCNLESWGIQKTEKYYNAWKSLPNCNYVNGNYVDLFMTSDALIHDCSSFTAEYLYVNKPLMYLTKEGRKKPFNAFADACFQVNYHGSSISDIETFIENVIEGIDPMLEKRTKFINSQLTPKGNETVAGTIYKELCKLFD